MIAYLVILVFLAGEEKVAQETKQETESSLSFTCFVSWADRESPEELLCHQNDAKFS